MICDFVLMCLVNIECFYYYDMCIVLYDLFEILFDSYDKFDCNGNFEGGWQMWFCSEVFKVIIEVIDDVFEGMVEMVVGFDVQLFVFQLPQFGVFGFCNYIFYSIIGLIVKFDVM